MIADSYYEIGSSHLYCQDYATHGSFLNYQGEEIYYTVVADGCSSAMDSDIGARVLTHSAITSIKNIFGGCLNPDYDNIYETLGRMTLNGARIIQRVMGNSDESLYSTLLVSVCAKKFNFSAIYGDGFIVFEREDSFHIVCVDFPSNAPYYLAYWDNPVELERYRNEFGERKKITSSWWIKSSGELDEETTSSDLSYNYPSWKTSSDMEEIKSISLFTDGAETFRLDNGMCKDDIETEKVISDILSIKGTRGEFLQRQMLWYKKMNSKQGIHHYDDLGCAMIIVEEDNES